ncbi:DUF2075 domain-containing protein [Xanthocytophaga agilis]|uniref:DUF2075 domain-containing protein n=1 Tax=Xanthocytophaga agilis TaxID=3048010 RepID=A0AAE3UFY7_9BACT|nr:DUF2075 domain-containing protein [Xanthocytophaga agilis]MDJ1501842.1 DUF2075 domain-containing protein [Xanthocytophaga agilis]
MIAYTNTSKGFIEDVETNQISTKIRTAVLQAFGWAKVNSKEEEAWINSMQFMGNVIRRSSIADDCGVLIEYNLPSTSLRVDFILTGTDEAEKQNFIIIELKQWKEASATTKDGVVFTSYHGNEAHPSYQAYSYKLFLKDFNENIYNSSLRAFSCAYLHNYVEKDPEPLKAKIYESIVKESPLYLKNDQKKLEEFIRTYVGKGKGSDIIYHIEKGNIRPSKKLIDHVAELFKHNMLFHLLDNQKVAFEIAKDFALNAKSKTIVIITGGPGTGKSVISMNLLAALLKKKNAVFVAPTASFRDVMVSALTSSFGVNRIKHLFKGSSSFFGAKKNTFDILIVDEAHRLKNEKAFMYKGKNQVEDIVNAAQVSIFFIDEKQMIRPDDIGTVQEITRVAQLHKAQVHTLNLTAQFRCSGADGYINWIDDVLQLQATGNFNGWDKQDFEFKICDDPNELRELIKSKNDEGLKARILAGYAWKWTAADAGNLYGEIEDVSIPEFDFSMPWNSRSSGSTWAIDEEGVDQIGCVHTSQGLEFDYVGVIIGNDLRFNPTTSQYFTQWKEYLDTKGKSGLNKKPADLNKLVRNIYRILLTRGMKGCYVYFMDKEVEKYFRMRS